RLLQSSSSLPPRSRCRLTPRRSPPRHVSRLNARERLTPLLRCLTSVEFTVGRLPAEPTPCQHPGCAHQTLPITLAPATTVDQESPQWRSTRSSLQARRLTGWV